jgi:hypothetical protein
MAGSDRSSQDREAKVTRAVGRLDLPFEHLDRTGAVRVRCGPNSSPVRSGFDALGRLGFDPAMCLGYPTMRARIVRYAGSGYRTCMAWIQIIRGRRYSSLGDTQPATDESEVDTSPLMSSLGVPFFAHGYPAAIYDAPCNNLGDAARLEWTADTFLVTYPSRLNNERIAFLAGFRWGYAEWDDEGTRLVALAPLEAMDAGAWHAHLTLLRDTYPHWTYE